MKRKIFTYIILCISVCCVFCGCGNSPRTTTQGNNTMAYLTGTQDEQCDKLMDMIVECLKTKDTTGLQDLFSEQTRHYVPSLKEQVENCIQFIRGDILSYEGFSNYAQSLHWGDDGGTPPEGFTPPYWRVGGDYTIITSQQTYSVSFVFYSDCFIKREQDGMYLLEITTEDGEYIHNIYTDYGAFAHGKDV